MRRLWSATIAVPDETRKPMRALSAPPRRRIIRRVGNDPIRLATLRAILRAAMARVRMGYDRNHGRLSERSERSIGSQGLCEAQEAYAAMMPSGDGVPQLPELDRVMQLAYEHGYRVGLQIGEHGRYVVHVRDLSNARRVIAILGGGIEDCAAKLFIEMLRQGYVPRGDLEAAN